MNKEEIAEQEDAKQQREQAIREIDKAYYDRNSPHYKDNDRYRWAIDAINKTFPEPYSKK